MQQNLLKKLIAIGLAEHEAQVYLANLETGTAPASDIARSAHLNRVTTYSILKRLLTEGFVTRIEKEGVHHFTPLAPELLIEDIQKRADSLAMTLPQLKSLMGGHTSRPVVRFFEGMDAVKKAYEETLDAHTEILNYANSKNIRDHWPDYDRAYVFRRAQSGIFLRGLAPEDAYGREVQLDDSDYVRETRLLPLDHFQVENEINIFDDKVMITSFEPQTFAIIIQSQAVADTQRQIFEMAWGLARG